MKNFVRLVQEALHRERGDEPRAVLVDLLATHGLSPQMVVDALSPAFVRRRAFDTVQVMPGFYAYGAAFDFFRNLEGKRPTETNLEVPRVIRNGLVVRRVQAEARGAGTPEEWIGVLKFFTDWEIHVATEGRILLQDRFATLLADGATGRQVAETTVAGDTLIYGYLYHFGHGHNERALPRAVDVTLSLEEI